MSNQTQRKTFAGFVDLQVNGYRGIDFSSLSLTIDSATHALRGILSDGACTAIVPTIISSSLDVYNHVLPIFAEIKSMKEFHSRIIGIHLEGPFISPKEGAVGCHNASNVRLPSIKLLEDWQKLSHGNICLITLAAEIEGACKLIEYCDTNKIVVSLGHQDSSNQEIDRAVEAGAKVMTHLGNGIPNMIHRHDNMIWKGLSDDRLTVMLITDGSHLPKDVLRVMFRSKPSHLIVVTSDVAPVAGLPDGTYKCFGTSVVVKGTRVQSATLPCLAGSGALMLHCINHLCKVWPLHFTDNPNKSTSESAFELMTRVGFTNPLYLMRHKYDESFQAIDDKAHILTWMDNQFYFTGALL